jgi:hypothetical protein
METYVVLGHSGSRKNPETRVVYVGSNEEKAFCQEANEFFHSFSVELWVDEIPLKSWYGDKKDWRADAWTKLQGENR